ncbi:putative glyoxalase superfamily metalloenzyme YdcJ [Actinoplanes lutulentus]|uniref:2-oxoadipate dioxygenase/decarboxylase n=1 Tax=Actinoplanes lutulentus TaxID=1287878 RepID=A0A327ZJ72_9ACTN|nr:VOC family protein [Actinoplanes lutulentus]MBB2940716.1 putative glyoxalase superfamily metalloenzyme YdcJ [Actinoplanes lutulentus]RAK43027.1 putative glyoxalase superfamily metalloenzyme YdcJ [Actinoplanes lutulentus]
MSSVGTTELRARFARRLSELYGTEVPAYTTLVDECHLVNQRVLDRDGAAAERFGSISRVTAERHGAIRVGTPAELSQVARIFGALGMVPAGFYDLRDAYPQPIPVISTAFRPVETDELALNPFRVFTSMLVPQDRRFFSPDLEKRLLNFLDRRRLFPDELLGLADRAEAFGGLSDKDAARFLDLAAAAFALSPEPVDRAWYTELEKISGVAADIGGVTSTHINHLTPRVLDIDELYTGMQARGIAMIDEIQGPPRWHGPDVLLRQTSFRALAEPRAFREADGTISEGRLRVRFGEVEARGIALTPAGRGLYDDLVADIDQQVAAGAARQEIAPEVWAAGLPDSEIELAKRGLAFFTFSAHGDFDRSLSLSALLDGGFLTAQPIVYEDFLPRSAAGIFASNLTDAGAMDASQGGAPRDREWLADVIGRPIRVPEEIYAAQQEESLLRSGVSTTIDGGARQVG